MDQQISMWNSPPLELGLKQVLVITSDNGKLVYGLLLLCFMGQYGQFKLLCLVGLVGLMG